MTNYKMYVGGEWVDAAAGETFETKNPYTGESWATMPRGRAADATALLRHYGMTEDELEA